MIRILSKPYKRRSAIAHEVLREMPQYISNNTRRPPARDYSESRVEVVPRINDFGTVAADSHNFILLPTQAFARCGFTLNYSGNFSQFCFERHFFVNGR
jgi:hypothetical protein